MSARNQEQISDWNGPVGGRWLTYNDWLDERTAAYGEMAFAAAAPQPGEAVLDIGCGAGATSLELARAVGASGRVIGVDVSEPLIGRARERAQASELPIEFRLADASAPLFAPNSFDLLFSRFGVMFFDDPAAAFTELRKTLKPGGRIAFACWQEPAKNDWYVLPLNAIAGIVEQPSVDTNAPGPFAFSDPKRVERILTEAGFAQVELRAFEAPFYYGRGDTREAMAEDALQQVFRVGPIQRLLAAQSEQVRERAAAAIRAKLTGLANEQGIAVSGAIWVVTARRGHDSAQGDLSQYERAESLIRAMAEYVIADETALSEAQAQVGAQPLRLVCINMLSWLSSRSRCPTMVANSKRFWGSAWQTLSTLLSVPGAFSDVFEFQGEAVVLNPGLTPEQIRELCKLVAEIYRPRRFITVRKPSRQD